MTKKRNSRAKDSTTEEESESEEAKQIKVYEKKNHHLESLNQSLMMDVEELRKKLEDVAISSHCKSNSQSKKNISENTSLNVLKLKVQKVKLQCKIKKDSMQFRILKASLEKEILKVKKELRKSEFEKKVMAAMNKRQKMILQLKNKQLLAALKRSKLPLRSEKICSNKNYGPAKETTYRTQEEEVELVMNLEKIHSDYEFQMKEIAEEVRRFSLEAKVLNEELEVEQNSCSSCENRIEQNPIDAELKELKVEVNKLSTFVSQMEMTKFQHSNTDKMQSKKDTLESSQPKEPKLCCSCTRKSLCKTKNCKCKASGIGCGEFCSCLASRCKNRD